MLIQELPVDERPRERLVRLGPEALSTVELLAVLLGSGGGRGRSALVLAQGLLTGPEGLEADPRAAAPGTEGFVPALVGLSCATVGDLTGLAGIGPAKAGRIVAAIELGKRVAAARRDRAPVRSPADISAMFGERLRHLDREHFLTVMLDTKNQVLAVEVVSVGSLDSSLVHPREIFKAAIRSSSSAVILLHNHPSGDPTPSEADIACTKRLSDAGRMLGIAVLDHVVIGDGKYVSFRESGIGGLSAGVE